MDERTLAYVAGVVDLLGLIRVRTLTSGTQLPVVQLHGNFMPTFEYFSELTATKAIVTRRSYSRAGCAEHCKEKHQHVVSTSGRWSLTGAKATILLWNIRPFLRLHQEQAIAALNVGLSTRFKAGVVEQMKDLGWEIPDFTIPPSDKPECSIADCPSPTRKRGWCNAHYIRWRRYGDPLGSASERPSE